MGEQAKLLDTEESGAVFSPDRVYRYLLWRHWDREKGHVLWCMLNPSTADETKLDPTLRRCRQYSLDWGYGGFEVVNLFAYRATDPKAMRAAADPIGGENRDAIVSAARHAHLIVVGWGKIERREREHAADIHGCLLAHGPEPLCLGMNGDGSPKHPLYLKADTKLVVFV